MNKNLKWLEKNDVKLLLWREIGSKMERLAKKYCKIDDHMNIYLP